MRESDCFLSFLVDDTALMCVRIWFVSILKVNLVNSSLVQVSYIWATKEWELMFWFVDVCLGGK